MSSGDEFFNKWRGQFGTNEHGKFVYPKDHEMDVYLLIVVDDIPTTTIDKILRDNEPDHTAHSLRVADTYEKLPDFNGRWVHDGTKPPIDPSWKSPFVGKLLGEVTAWMRGIPKPPKAACKAFFAVVQKELYETTGEILMCKMLKSDDETETIRIRASKADVWFTVRYRDHWGEDMNKEYWRTRQEAEEKNKDDTT